MNWVLIVFIFETFKVVSTFSSIPMDTETACHAAGKQAVATFEDRFVTVKYLCARKR
jgi:hypothetical protein